MYLAYSILYLIALLFLFPFEYLKRPKELRRQWLRERLGFLSLPIHPFTHPPIHHIWIHAVSVGEAIAAVPLIKKIKERHPAAEVIVSTVTDTGQKVARERIGDIARIVYVPFDLPFTIGSVFKKIKPSLFIIMETELWPNAIRIFSRSGVPVLLMNGRISGKSFGGYKKLRFFIKDVLKNVSIFCMQNELYAERIKELSADPDKVKAIGNFKFDTKPSSRIPEWTKILKEPKSEVRSQKSEEKKQEFTIIAGSTHRTEEELIIDAYIKLKADFPQINLIVAPRHPERFKEVEELIKKRGIEYIKRSGLAWSVERGAWSINNNNSLFGAQRTTHNAITQSSGVIVLLDVIGELSSVYSACDVAIMGGSFIEHGGQNPLEPAYWEKAILCGPHMENFPFINDFYKSGGAIRVDAENLYQTVKELLNSQGKMLSMGKIAKVLYEKNTGATDRAMEIIDLIIGNQKTEHRTQTKDPELNSLLVTRYSLLERLYYIGYTIKKRQGLKNQKRLPHKVISIGNITVGGAGKTPATIAIAEEAKKRGFQPIILTRGYRGKVKGPCFVTPSLHHSITSSLLFGDEPVLMSERLKDVPIVKCSDRYEGGMFALQHLSTHSPIHPFTHSPILFILDDGFQHRGLYRDMDIVLIDGLNPFGNRRLLPMGPLREPLNELKRADIFVVTKTKNKALSDELRNINPEAPVYLSEYRIHKVRDMDGNEYPIEVLKDKKVYAFCGIANPESFGQTVLSITGEVRGFKTYRDHYKYTKTDMDYLKKKCKDLICDFLITTEKDMVKLRELCRGSKSALENLLCIEIGFYVDKDIFDAIF